MKFIKIAVVAIAMAFATASIAAPNTIDTTKLSAEQVAQLQLEAAKIAAQADKPQNVSKAVREEAEAWGELGGHMGDAIVGAAGKLGVAAGEFAQTPLGKVTVAVVAWKVVGKSILGLFWGLIVISCGVPAGYYILKSTRWGNNYRATYDYKPYLWGLWNRRVITEIVDTEDSGTKFFRQVIGVFIIIISFPIGWAFM